VNKGSFSLNETPVDYMYPSFKKKNKRMMNKFLIFALILFASCSNSQSQQEKESEKNNYPENYGFDSGVLSEMVKDVKAKKLNVNSILIQRNNVTVLNSNFYPQKAEYLHDVASVSKSITSILVGIAIDKGYMESVDQQIIDFFPDQESVFNTDSKKSITIEHLLTMTSGICSDFSQGENMREAIKTSKSPLVDILVSNLSNSPGEKLTYCSPGVQLLSIIIQKSSGMTMEKLAKDYLFKPLNIKHYHFGTDVNGFTNASGDIFLTSSDLAKLGQLILDKGVFNGIQVVSKTWIEQSTTKKVARSNGEYYGYLWWLRDDLGGLIEAQGRGGQRLIILPEKKLVLVMYGTGFDPGQIGEYIVKALKGDKPIEQNIKNYQLLQKEIELAQNPSTENNDVVISPKANEICSKTYKFEQNPIGFEQFTLCAQNPDSAYIYLDLNIEKSNEVGNRKVPLGLKGKYKISNATRFQTPMAAKAKWVDNNTIVIDYNEFSNAHKYEITVSFQGNKASFSIKDEAEYGNETKLVAESE
jgi:CubicO group peptidase (beta-lactamase class C family)